MEYISVKEAAKKWNLSDRSVRNYCANGKIPGAILHGNAWKIPEAAKNLQESNGRVKYRRIC